YPHRTPAHLVLISFPPRRSSDHLRNDFLLPFCRDHGLHLFKLFRTESVQAAHVEVLRLGRPAESGFTAADTTMAAVHDPFEHARSEEHSLNSSHQIISYAVFCLT